ncbi:MAG: hypothetical protein WCL18_00855 [bacterium]
MNHFKKVNGSIIFSRFWKDGIDCIGIILATPQKGPGYIISMAKFTTGKEISEASDYSLKMAWPHRTRYARRSMEQELHDELTARGYILSKEGKNMRWRKVEKK